MFLYTLLAPSLPLGEAKPSESKTRLNGPKPPPGIQRKQNKAMQT